MAVNTVLERPCDGSKSRARTHALKLVMASPFMSCSDEIHGLI